MQVGGTVPRVIMRAIKLDKTGLYSTRASKCHVNFSWKREFGDGGSTLMGVARIRAWTGIDLTSRTKLFVSLSFDLTILLDCEQSAR